MSEKTKGTTAKDAEDPRKAPILPGKPASARFALLSRNSSNPVKKRRSRALPIANINMRKLAVLGARQEYVQIYMYTCRLHRNIIASTKMDNFSHSLGLSANSALMDAPFLQEACDHGAHGCGLGAHGRCLGAHGCDLGAHECDPGIHKIVFSADVFGRELRKDQSCLAEE